MNELFADTSFFISFLSLRDAHHALASQYMDQFSGRIMTSALILVELGNYLSGSSNRRLFIPFTQEQAGFVVLLK